MLSIRIINNAIQALNMKVFKGDDEFIFAGTTEEVNIKLHELGHTPFIDVKRINDIDLDQWVQKAQKVHREAFGY